MQLINRTKFRLFVFSYCRASNLMIVHRSVVGHPWICNLISPSAVFHISWRKFRVVRCPGVLTMLGLGLFATVICQLMALTGSHFINQLLMALVD